MSEGIYYLERLHDDGSLDIVEMAGAQRIPTPAILRSQDLEGTLTLVDMTHIRGMLNQARVRGRAEGRAQKMVELRSALGIKE